MSWPNTPSVATDWCQLRAPLLSAQRSWPLPGKLQRAPNLLCSLASDWLAQSSRSYRTAPPRFSAECRGQENAEAQSEDLSEDIGRQEFGDVFRFLRLGIIFRCSAAASIGRLKTRVAYRLVGTEPAYRSVVWFWQALPPSARDGRANKFGLFRLTHVPARAQ
jgi:hypothetical protein